MKETYKPKILFALILGALIPLIITFIIVKESFVESRLKSTYENKKHLSSIAVQTISDSIKVIEEKAFQAYHSLNKFNDVDSATNLSKWLFKGALKDYYSLSLYKYENKKAKLIFEKSNSNIKYSKKVIGFLRKKYPLDFFKMHSRLSEGNRFIYASQLTSKKKKSVTTYDVLTIVTEYTKSKYLVIDVKKTLLDSVVNKIGRLYSNVFVLNLNGKMIVSSRKNEKGEIYNPANIIQGSPLIEKYYSSEEGASVYGLFSIIPSTNIGILFETEKKDVPISDIGMVLKKIFVIGSFSLFLSFFFFLFVGPIKSIGGSKEEEYDITDSETALNFEDDATSTEITHTQIPEVAQKISSKGLFKLGKSPDKASSKTEAKPLAVDDEESDTFLIKEFEDIESESTSDLMKTGEFNSTIEPAKVDSNGALLREEDVYPELKEEAP